MLGEESMGDSTNVGHLPIRAHNSKVGDQFDESWNDWKFQVQLMVASNCGQILQEREDPFDLKVIESVRLNKGKRRKFVVIRKRIMAFIKM